MAHIIIRGAAHVASFALLGLFASLLARSYRLKRWFVITFIACTTYAVFDECHQLWIAAGRAFEVVDIVKDAIGVVIGAGLAVALTVVYRRIRQNRKKGC